MDKKKQVFSKWALKSVQTGAAAYKKRNSP